MIESGDLVVELGESESRAVAEAVGERASVRPGTVSSRPMAFQRGIPPTRLITLPTVGKLVDPGQIGVLQNAPSPRNGQCKALARATPRQLNKD
jgi:hypothetical protein